MQIRTIRMQILTIQNVYEAFECKFEPLKWIQSIRMQIWTIEMGFQGRN